MRNLKKVLSLVLCLSMVLGLMVVGAGAKSFTDDDQIVNKEAAAVATDLGVIVGTGDGSTFSPEKTLTRAEAATIAARMLLGPDAADKLKTDVAPFTDVPADNWAAGYIAYCSAQGILAGVGNDKYNPTGVLHVNEFAKIMLTALGYDADIEGLVGSDWAVNTAALAGEKDLMDTVEDTQSFIDEITRDNAVQMVLNTLKATMVDYAGKGTTVTTADGTTVKTDASAAQDKETSNDTKKIKDDGYVQFAEKYFKDLEYKETDTGDYGRPDGFQWTNKGEEVYTGNDDSTLVATYTDTTKKTAVYKDIGSADYKDFETVNVVVNGVPVEEPVAKDQFMVKSGSGDAAYTDKGVQVELYYDSDTKVATAVVIYTYLAEVTKDYDSNKEELPNINVYSNSNYPAPKNTVTAISNDDFAVSNYVKDDYVLVTFDDGDLASIAPAKTVEGEINSYKIDSNVTVEGTAYKYGPTMDSKEFATDSYSIGSNIVLLTDDYGFVLGYTDAETDSDYVFVKNIGQVSSRNKTVEADLYFPDGTTEFDAVIKEADLTNDGKDNAEDADVVVDNIAENWYTYETNSNGSYSLTSVPTSGDKDYTVAPLTGANWSTDAKVNFVIESKTGTDGKITSDANTTYKANNNSVLVSLDSDDNYKSYTGYGTFPTINKNGLTNNTAITLYLVIDEDGYVAYTFVDAGDAKIAGNTTTSTDLVFIYGGPESGKDSNKDTVYYYDAVTVKEDGTATDDSVTATSNFVTDAEGYGLYRDIVYDANNYIDDQDPIVAGDKDDEDDGYIRVDIKKASDVTEKAGTLTIGDKSYAEASDVAVYLFEIDNGSYSYDDSYSVADLVDDDLAADDVVFLVQDSNDNVTAIYILANSSMGTGAYDLGSDTSPSTYQNGSDTKVTSFVF